MGSKKELESLLEEERANSEQMNNELNKADINVEYREKIEQLEKEAKSWEKIKKECGLDDKNNTPEGWHSNKEWSDSWKIMEKRLKDSIDEKTKLQKRKEDNDDQLKQCLEGFSLLEKELKDCQESN